MDQLIRSPQIYYSHFSKGKKNQPIERIIPGREFHGTVVSSKYPKFEVGDNVVGLKHPTETFGTLSEYVSSSGTFILHNGIATLYIQVVILSMLRHRYHLKKLVQSALLDSLCYPV